MSTLHKVKAYFGMVPLDAYDDRYVDDDRARGRRGLDSEFDERHEGGFDDYRDDRSARGYAYEGYAGSYDDGYRSDSYDDGGYSERRYETTRYRDERPEPARLPRLEPLSHRGGRPDAASAPSTRGALALDTRADAQENPMSRITTLRPTSYEEARTIGERFRDGIPVIMDLTEMDNADAKRLVDFAAGLTFALHGSFDRITTKVFMLATADVNVTAEERARIAETGFYNH